MNTFAQRTLINRTLTPRNPAVARLNPPRNMLRRLGAIGFSFFLIKGLMWLAAPFVFLLLQSA